MKRNNQIFVTKASGQSVVFSPEKLRNSLKRAGADDNTIENIEGEINMRIYNGIPTKKIYRMAFALLKESSRYLAAKYHLKRAIMDLGPSGYPFEKFVGEILANQGFAIKIGEIVQGKCVSHEIDVIAQKDHSQFMIECKYHNQQGKVSDVKIPLYINSRFLDVKDTWMQSQGEKTKFYQGWVITNTKFSSDAISYGKCAGLKMIGWDYPLKGSLKDLIDTLRLYPLTCLTTLTRSEKQNLLKRNIVLCKELFEHKNYLVEAGISSPRIKNIMDECRQLC